MSVWFRFGLFRFFQTKTQPKIRLGFPTNRRFGRTDQNTIYYDLDFVYLLNT